MNDFNYGAILEVAILFLGIFICMQPALQLLDAAGDRLHLDSPYKFFWASGTLSSFLDNAPTYLVYFEVANSMTHCAGPRHFATTKRPFHPRRFAGRNQLGGGVHGRDDLYRQRAEFHGQIDRRIVGRQNAQLLRLHGL